MINHSLSRFENARPMPLHTEYKDQTGVSYIVEGMAFINSLEDGVARVRPSTGTPADGSFLGISAEVNRTQTTAVAVENVTTTTAAVATLTNAPTSIDFLVLDESGTTPVALTVQTAAAPAATAVRWQAASPRTLTFNSANASKTYKVVYRYSPTIQQATILFGHGNVQGNVSPGEVANVMTVITHGEVYTDQFDTGSNWTAADITQIRTGANGLFSLDASSTELIAGGESRIQVTHAPSVNVPYLGLLLL